MFVLNLWLPSGGGKMLDVTQVHAVSNQVLPAASWFALVGLGAAAGVIGQGIRSLVGLKKVGDQASSTQTPMNSLIEPRRLVVSLLIGGIAGVLAAITLIGNLAAVSSEQFFAVMAAGYAGADFIEGFIGRATPDAASLAPAKQSATPANPDAAKADGAQQVAPATATSDGSVG